MDRTAEVVIIGAGPAGMTAAIYASRAGLKTIMVDRGAPGGKMVNTYEIENYPGAAKVSGPGLSEQMFAQSTSFGAEYSYGEVTGIADGDPKTVFLADGTKILAPAVVIATGTVERKLGIPGEQELLGRGVSYCAVCDGAFFRGQTVTVIGGGNSALAEALYLTKFASLVKVVIRRDVFRATEIVQKALLQAPNVRVIRKKLPVRILSEGGKVSAIVLRDADTGAETTEETKAVFPYIGADPITGFTAGLGLATDKGYINVNSEMETNVKGIYAVGDVRQKELRQVITAAADGAIAAEAISHRLKG